MHLLNGELTIIRYWLLKYKCYFISEFCFNLDLGAIIAFNNFQRIYLDDPTLFRDLQLGAIFEIKLNFFIIDMSFC